MSESKMNFVIDEDDKLVIDYIAKIMNVPDSVIVSQIVEHTLDKPYLDLDLPRSCDTGTTKQIEDRVKKLGWIHH